MNRRALAAMLGGAVLARPLAALAQSRPGIPLVGVLMGANPAIEAAKLGTFREALAKLGYIEGRNILVEPRYADGHADRLAELARELAARKPAVIACVGVLETAAAQAATRTTPIVFFQVRDPVQNGVVATLARPGGNTTGFSQISTELDAKRLELLHEIVPSLSRVAFLMNPSFVPGLPERFADAAAAAKTLGIALRRVDAVAPADLPAAFAAIEAASSEALLVQNDPMLSGTEFSSILSFTLAHRLPAIYEGKANVPQGALLGYGSDSLENARLAAGYVDRILKGAKPSELPVQQPTKFIVAINLKTAKALGLTVPQSLLARADEVIE